jgi:hypothetical protein
MDYTTIRQKAAAQIRSKGKPVTLVVPGADVFDPTTGKTTPGVATSYAAKAVELGYELKDRDGTRVQSNDRRFLLAALTDAGVAIPKPSTAMRLTVGAVSMAIVQVDPLEPGDTALIYEVQCRA